MKNKEFIIGKLKEAEFSKLFSKVVNSTKDEDMYEHWDVNIGAKIDVKSLKKESREDLMYNENFHWIELLNVNGDRSWLYGDADYFAFETNDYWLLVEKHKLQDFMELKTKDKSIGHSKDPYELYRRTGRKDIVVKVKTIDLFYLATQIIKKDETDNQK